MPGIAIIGASGLIGHMLYYELGRRFGRVVPILHGSADVPEYGLFCANQTVDNVDVADFAQVTGVLQDIKPDVVLNCAGITKRRPEIHDPVRAISVNALFPHRLAAWATARHVRIIHFSTDCVFDGAAGPYTEDSPSTAKDAYGRTKALGEINMPGCLTIRSSFIGRELERHSELLEWFLQQQGKRIRGFARVYYSGVSTIEMARVVGDIIADRRELSGLYQLAMPDPISKYDLLCLARDAFDRDIDIVPETETVSHPTLDGSKLATALDLRLASWQEMLADLAALSLYPPLRSWPH